MLNCLESSLSERFKANLNIFRCSTGWICSCPFFLYMLYINPYIILHVLEHACIVNCMKSVYTNVIQWQKFSSLNWVYVSLIERLFLDNLNIFLASRKPIKMIIYLEVDNVLLYLFFWGLKFKVWTRTSKSYGSLVAS